MLEEEHSKILLLEVNTCSVGRHASKSLELGQGNGWFGSLVNGLIVF